jgi:cell division protein ZapD
LTARVILYEYPFNERIRTYLRLEHLFVRLSQLLARESAMDHHFALATIFEIMDVGARADLKSDVLKDLDKQKAHLDAYRGNPAIAEGVLDEVIGQLDLCFQTLNGLPGKAGQSLTENDWLMSIRSRIGIPGGTCEFDLPAYYAWQFKPAAQRQQDLSKGRTFQLLRLALDPALGLIPEISGNRLLVSIRLMQQGDDDRLHLSGSDTDFELALCA